MAVETSIYVQLSSVESVADAREAMARFTQALGGVAWLVRTVTEAGQGVAERALHSLGPDEAYIVQAGPSTVGDPLTIALKVPNRPVFWNRATYEEAGELEMWEEQSALGMTHGVAVHVPMGKYGRFDLAIDWSDENPLVASQLQVAMNSVHVAALCAHSAFQRMWRLADEPLTKVSLTPRERECLLWVSRGLGDIHVAQVLGLSARTVRKHVDNAMAKLGAASRTQAVAVANRLDLLEAIDAPTVTVRHIGRKLPRETG